MAKKTGEIRRRNVEKAVQSVTSVILRGIGLSP